MFLYIPKVLLSDKIDVLRRYVGSFSLYGMDKTSLFELIVRAFRGDDADSQVLGEIAYRWKQHSFRELSVDDLCLDLAGDLLVNGLSACVAQ